MKVVYLASPYRNKRENGVWLNINKAHMAARELWKIGVACISPCSNTAFFGGDDIPDQTWFDGDDAIIKKCDAMFMNDGWEQSSGCRHEKELAEYLGIPVFEYLSDLKTWVANQTNESDNSPKYEYK